MVEVSYTWKSAPVTIRLPRQLVCDASFRFRKLCHRRSNRSFAVKDLIGMTEKEFEVMTENDSYVFHDYISCFAVWLDTAEPTTSGRPFYHALWLFGQLLQAPKFMNDVMRKLFYPEEDCEMVITEFAFDDYNEGKFHAEDASEKRVDNGEWDSSSPKQVDLEADRNDKRDVIVNEEEEVRDVAGALDSTKIIECWKHAIYCYGDGEEFHTLVWRNKKMLKYLVDWFAYSGMKGRGGYNRIAREVPELAMQVMKAIGVREAIKQGRPPWHEENQWKYLVDENMGKDWFTN